MLRVFFAALLLLSLCVGPALAAEKKYIVASDATWPPMELLDAKKQVDGYSSDYIKAVAKEVGMEVELRNVAWDSIFIGVAAGNFDIIASSVTITPEREKQFTFSNPYCAVHQALTVRHDSSIQALKELQDKRVGGQIGTTGIMALRNAKVGAEIREYEDVELAMQDLANGRLDAVICDDPIARYYANKNKDSANRFKVALIMPDAEYYGFVVKLGRTDLAERLNQGIKAVQDKGIEKELQARWMGTPQ